MLATKEVRRSALPRSVELIGATNTGSFGFAWADRIPREWLGLIGYIVAGVFLGLALILAIGLTGNGDARPRANAGVVTDDVTRLHAREIGDTCWSGDSREAARLTVSMAVGVDGRVRSAIASGESAQMRSCVEALVSTWEFLPQAQAQAMVLPFEIDRR